MRKRTTLFFITLLLLTSCSSQETKSTDSAQRLRGEVVELRDLLTPSDIVVTDNRIYALDTKAKQVMVYTAKGELLHIFGRAGRGPGEFIRPVSLAVHENHIVVSERSSRTSVFDTTGVFLHSFVAIGVMHINSNMKILNDSLLLLGGLREEAGDLYGGMLAHIYTIDGVRKHDFMPVSEKAGMYKTTLIVGANCDRDAAQNIWCTQPMDYTIRKYDYTGDLIGSFTASPPYYRPLREEQPQDARSKAVGEWITAWDKTMGLYSINDSLLVSEVMLGKGGRKIDLIHKRNGNVLATHDVEGKLLYVDKDNQRLVFERPATEDPVTTLEIVPLTELFKLGRGGQTSIGLEI